MELAHVIAFNIALLAALVSPGPAMICAMQTAMSRGRRTGVQVGLGLASVAAGWVLLALLGFDWIFALYPWLYLSAKVLGGIYLIYVAYTMWRSSGDDFDETTHHFANPFIHGALINLLNPKSVLFGAAMLVVVFPPNLSLVEILFIAANQFIVEGIFYGLIAFGLSTRPLANRYIMARKYIDKMAASILAVLGLRLIWNK